MRAKGEAREAGGHAALEVLWAGQTLTAIDALRARGIRVTQCSAERCIEQIEARAPDMLVVSDFEARQAEDLVSGLCKLDMGTVPWMMVLASDVVRAKTRFRNLRSVGCLALDTPASVLARAVDDRLRDIASRSPTHELSIAWRDVDAWLATAAREGRSGFLIRNDPAGALALGPGGHAAPKPPRDTAPARVRDAEPRSMTFMDVPERRLYLLRDPPAPGDTRLDLQGASIAVVHAVGERRAAYAKALREVGAEAHEFDLEPSHLERLPSLSPALIVIAAAGLDGAASALLLGDARLASVCWLVVDESRLASMAPDDIVGPAVALSATKRSLAMRLAEGALVVDRIESFGPAGWLKEVGRCTQPVTLLFKGLAGRGELQLAEGKIRGASFEAEGGDQVETGRAALQASLALRFGKVLVGPHESVRGCEDILAREAAPVCDAPPKPASSSEPARRNAARAAAEPEAPATPERSAPRVAAPAKPLKAPERSMPPVAARSPSAGPPAAPERAAPFVAARPPSVQAPAAPEEPSRPPSPAPPLLPETQVAPKQRPGPSERALPPQAAPTAQPSPAPEPVPSDASSSLRRRLLLGSAACLGAALVAFALLRSPAGGNDHAESPGTTASRALARPALEPLVAAPATPEVELANQHLVEPSSTRPADQNSPAPDIGAEGQAPAAPEASTRSPANIAEAAALYERAKRASEASRHAEAESLLAEALELRPDHYPTRYQMALTLVRRRRFEQAHEHLNQAIELNPGSPMPWLLKGDALLQEGKRREAIAAWTRCLKVRSGLETCEERLARWRMR